jgi:hypothetical protein
MVELACLVRTTALLWRVEVVVVLIGIAVRLVLAGQVLAEMAGLDWEVVQLECKRFPAQALAVVGVPNPVMVEVVKVRPDLFTFGMTERLSLLAALSNKKMERHGTFSMNLGHWYQYLSPLLLTLNTSSLAAAVVVYQMLVAVVVVVVCYLGQQVLSHLNRTQSSSVVVAVQVRTVHLRPMVATQF